jgi:hypothetical protein
MRTRSAAAVLATLATAVVLQVGGASPAHACSCVGGRTDAQAAADADAVFVGRVVAERRSSQAVTWTLDVETVVKGDVPQRHAVRSAAYGASCGAELDMGGWYLVLAETNADGTVSTGLCSGNRDVPPHYVPTTFGAVTTPRPGSAGRVQTTTTGGIRAPWPVALAAALALAVAIGAVVAASRRRG